VGSDLQGLYGAVRSSDGFSVNFHEPFGAGLPYLDGHRTKLQTFPSLKRAPENLIEPFAILQFTGDAINRESSAQRVFDSLPQVL
jgi:hypothetical protein